MAHILPARLEPPAARGCARRWKFERRSRFDFGEASRQLAGSIELVERDRPGRLEPGAAGHELPNLIVEVL